MKATYQCGIVLALVAVPMLLRAQTNLSTELPPIELIGRRFAEQVQKDDNERAFKQRYSYVRTRVTEYWSTKGELKKRVEKIRTNSPPSAPIESSSRPSEKDAKKGNSKDDTEFNGRGRAFERSDFTDVDDMFSRFEFTLVGRETNNGRSLLIIDFKPAREQPPERSIKDKFINKAAGRAWVDEREYELAKLNLYLTERVNVIGGLVGAVWKFNCDINRERTSDGFWFIRTMNWHLEGREVFIRRTMNFHEEKRDVKKVW
jgi:hypothetical protein